MRCCVSSGSDGGAFAADPDCRGGGGAVATVAAAAAAATAATAVCCTVAALLVAGFIAVVVVVPAGGVLGWEVVAPASMPGGTMGRTSDSTFLPLRRGVPVTTGVVEPGVPDPGDTRWGGRAC